MSEEGKGYYQKKGKADSPVLGFGYIHAYYGQGVGKTSRVVGLAVRAAAHERRVDFVQFMKSGDSGEVAAFRHFPTLRYYCPGPHPFISPQGPGPEHLDHARASLDFAKGAPERGTEILICDELLNTLIFGLLSQQDILSLAKVCRGRVELVMTGMDAPAPIIAACDYATEFLQVKHPYYQGVEARKAIEY